MNGIVVIIKLFYYLLLNNCQFMIYIYILDIYICEQILNKFQINKFESNLNNLMNECLLCKNLKNINSKIQPFYRLPINTRYENTLYFISKIIWKKDIKLEQPVLLNLDENRSSYVIHKLGISKIPVIKYYPIWQLYKKYNKIDIISSWNDKIDGFEINDHLQINFDGNEFIILDNNLDDFIDLQNDINAPIELLNNKSCYINNYNQINYNQLNILIKNYSKITIDYFKFQFIILENKFFIKFNDEIINF